MINQDLLKEAATLLSGNLPSNEALDQAIYAEIAAGSLQLEGIDTNAERVLSSAGITSMSSAA